MATVRMPDGGEVTLSLPTPAPHHLHNAAAALACATVLGLDPVSAVAAAGTFPGVRRRFEHVDTRAGVTVIDSYADHPHEIAADLDAARVLAGGRVIVVFQPSGHARVLAFGARIGQVLADKADHVLLLDVHGTVPPATRGRTSRPSPPGCQRAATASPPARIRWAGSWANWRGRVTWC